MLVDTHTHFYDEWLLPDAEAAIQRALEAGVGKMIQADIDSTERPSMWEIGRRHPGVLFQMLGLYPGSVTADNWQEELDAVYHLASSTSADGGTMPFSGADKKADAPEKSIVPPPASLSEATHNQKAPAFVAVGEIGLDYHEGKEFAAQQKEVLRLQLELAAKLDLPVNFHLRDAWEDFFTVLSDARHLHLRGNLHCFSGSFEIYERARCYGDFAVGIGGVVTFKNSHLAEAVARIPMEHLLLETDAPYLAPVPYRGKRNESAYLPLVAAKVAEIKGLPVEEVAAITTRNAETLFNL